MKRFSKYIRAVVPMLALAIATLAPAIPGSAASSSSLSIVPRKNYIIKPGDTVNDTLNIGNLDPQDDLNLSLRMIDFTFTNQSGTPKLSLAANAPQTPWSLRSFTTLPATVNIPAGGTKVINFSVTIPKNQGAGSYYSAILYQAGGANGGNVALNASGVSLVFVSVPGTVNEKLGLQKFGAYNSNDNGTTGSYVFIDANEQPKMIAYTVKNSGNVFEEPAGNIVITDTFGHQVANVTTNSTQSLALLGQTRIFTTCIKTVAQKIKLEGGTSTNKSCTNPNLRPGRYTAKLDVFYGQNGNATHEITATQTFWYLPWWFIAAVVVFLLLLALGIRWVVIRIRGAVDGRTYKRRK